MGLKPFCLVCVSVHIISLQKCVTVGMSAKEGVHLLGVGLAYYLVPMEALTPHSVVKLTAGASKSMNMPFTLKHFPQD